MFNGMSHDANVDSTYVGMGQQGDLSLAPERRAGRPPLCGDCRTKKLTP